MTHSIKQILVAVDLDEHTAHIIAKAAELAKHYNSKLKVIHCLQIFHSIAYNNYNLNVYFPDDTIAQMRQETLEKAKNHLDVVCAEYKDISVEIDVINGAVVESIIQISEDIKADLLVVGSRSNAGLLSFLGSTTNSLLNKNALDMFIVKI